MPKGEGELSGLHIIDPVPKAFHQVQKRWDLDFSTLSYEEPLPVEKRKKGREGQE